MQDFLKNKPDERTLDLIRKSGDPVKEIALAAQAELATALTAPLREGVLSGDNLGSIFSRIPTNGRSSLEYPLDLLAPGSEDEFIGYTNTGSGRIAERNVEGDYIMIPTYPIANSIDWHLRFARDANYPVVGRCMQVLEGGMTQKINDDGWHTILTGCADRNVLVFDSDATAGTFTKRLVSLAKTQMARSGGGNASSLRKARLTDIFLSLEALEDIRNWGLDQVDEVTRREIWASPDGTITRVFGVNLHPMYEFGENQSYQSYYTNTLGGSLPSGDLEIMVGLDLSAQDSFVMPMVEDMRVFADEMMHRRQKAGFYTWAELGFGFLDQRRGLYLSI